MKAGKYACYEFERRFLLKALPPELSVQATYREIEDTYFSGTDLRLRVVRDSQGKVLVRKLTQKYLSDGDGGGRAIITNIYLSNPAQALLAGLTGQQLRKRRYRLEVGSLAFTIDDFHRPAGLVLAEIEFHSEEEMRGFVCPFTDWVEVTGLEEFRGGQLALQAWQAP